MLARSIALGSAGASSGAAIAHTPSIASVTAPIIASRCDGNRRSVRLPGDCEAGAGPLSFVCGARSLFVTVEARSVITDSRVDESVRDIGREVRDQHD